MTIEAFLELNPPTFSRKPLVDDPLLFLNQTKNALGCPSERAVELATYNMEGAIK